MKEDLEIARLSRKVGLDFDDTLQYYVARQKRLALITLDRDFSKIKDIPVLKPHEILA